MPRSQPLVAGMIASLVGFLGAFPIVLAGLRGVGAAEAQAASGLLAVALLMPVAAIDLSRRLRMPVIIAWTTPGAALLIGAGPVDGGYPAALGAFGLCGVLLALSGLVGTLERAIRAIPVPIAAAVLAGVLLPVCLEPARATVAHPLVAGPVVLTWVVLLRVARRWAVLGALAVTLVVVLLDHPGGWSAGTLAPRLVFTAPELHVGTLIGLGVPLFVVTMASQNIPGMAVLASFGYHPPLRPVLTTTGALTVAGAPFGVAGINLAAITAALGAGLEAGPDLERRWLAGVSGGVTYLLLGLAAGLAAGLVAAAPDGLIDTAVGLALFAPLVGGVVAATASKSHREAALVTLVVTASGVSAGGISAPFWGLAAGLAFLGVQRADRLRGQ